MLLTTLALLAVAQPTEIRLMRSADVFGDLVVFNYASDLWVMNRNDGIARRLTSHPANETRPRFSPDGKRIAFSASYDGNGDVFVIPVEGGEPKRLTFTGTSELVQDWTPDGRMIAYSSNFGSHTNRTDRLWMISPDGGMPQRTPIAQFADGGFSPDGGTLVYNRNNSHAFNWRRYRGGTQGRISFFNLRDGSYTEIPARRENSWQPMWVGNHVYFISDRDFGTRNLFRYNVSNRRVERLTEFKDADIRNPQSDGKTIVWERDGFLQTFDIASGKVETLRAFIPSDFVTARPRLRSFGDSITWMSLSPTGARLMVEARGEVFSVPARNGETRNLTESSGIRERFPSWSPDGRTVLYLSDRNGETGIYTRPQMGGAETHHPTDPNHKIENVDWSPDGKHLLYRTARRELYLYNIEQKRADLVVRPEFQLNVAFDFSPDGAWIAYTNAGNNLQTAIFLYNVAEKKSTQITEGFYNDGPVAFDQSGKYLYFVSARTFVPEFQPRDILLNFAEGRRVYAVPLTKDVTNPMIAPSDEEPAAPAAPPAGGPPPGAGQPRPAARQTKVDLDGISDRVIALPWPAGPYNGIIGMENGVLVVTPAGVNLFSFNSRQSVPIIQGPVFGLAVNQNRNKMAVSAPGIMSIVDIRPGADLNAGRVNTSGVEMMWDPRAEWRQIYWEAWRYQRDRFYDPQFVGVNWEAVGKQYEKYLPYVAHRADLNYVLGLMIGELGTGHAYVGGGDPGEPVRQVATGHLGADYSVEGRFVRFARILRGEQYDETRRGPLGEPGLNVKEGDYLLEINGQPVTSERDPHELLVNRAGRLVTLTINSTPSLTGARKIQVRPVASETDLRYATWVEENRRKVAQMSNGRIGYIHVPDTGEPGMIEFIRGVYAQTDKDAWVIDDRYNGGGFIPTFFVDFLRRETVAGFKARDFGSMGLPMVSLSGPKVMLVNEFAGSGGDMLPWLFREQGLGKLVGNRTWGGLVGIQGSAQLVDGGFYTAPSFGIYDPKRGQWIAENEGVTPDVELDNRPDLVAKGQDPQLERAVQMLQEELRRGRPERRTPAFPRQIGGGN